MKYLPILQELFESDTYLFLIMGFVIALGIGFSNKRRCIKGIVISVVVYVVCELLSNIPSNYAIIFLLLFMGTIAVGACLGFVICLLFKLLSKII